MRGRSALTDLRWVEPGDTALFDAWYAVLRATDLERWPDLGGWSRREVHALVSAGDRSDAGATRYLCLAAVDASGPTVGLGLCELPQRDNDHGASLDVRVLSEHRRRGIGTAIVTEVERRVAAEGRTVLNGLVELPFALVPAGAATPFARRLGFVATQTGHRRHLTVPLGESRRTSLRQEVERTAVGYRTFAFVSPWPSEYLEDQCALNRRMSTDAPSGDAQHEEEVWDAARVEETDRLLATQGLTKLVSVAEHLASGRLVSFSELVLPRDHPHEAWQWATLVQREHRGHRLGLAVKLANLDLLQSTAPEVRVVITGNAEVNAPMIAVNDMLGFQVVANGTFWQKELTR
jgi:GNAT superfamily N-acetyltransferase